MNYTSPKHMSKNISKIILSNICQVEEFEPYFEVGDYNVS
jgi:hypothetical protein